MDVQKFDIFESRFNDDELENEFHAFFYKNNLTALFTNEFRVSTITVSYTEARSVINEGGSYNKVLKDFSEIITLHNDNKRYEDVLFGIIYESRTVQKMINMIKNILTLINSLTDDEFNNLWNIVFYSDILR